jgi:hypothetical protein
MKRSWLRTLIACVATAGLTVALLGLPAWGTDSDGDRTEDERAPQGAQRPTLALELSASPSGRAEFDRKLRDAVECMREHGAGPPGFESDRDGAILRSDSPEEIRRIAKECGLPPPPSFGELPAPPPRSDHLRLDPKERDRIEECLEVRPSPEVEPSP